MPQKKNKGLGRGLDALFTEFDETATADETVVELNLDDIRSNPYQPRKTFDETSLSELSDSIRKQGVFQPIIVRQSKVSGYEIIAGERRYRASKMAKRTTIPAIVRDLNEEEMMEIAVLENLQREDLTPLEEAQAYNTLMENLNLTGTGFRETREISAVHRQLFALAEFAESRQRLPAKGQSLDGTSPDASFGKG